MGFGGSAAAMIATLKNNKRAKSTTFKDMKNYQKTTYSQLHFSKKATPKQLQEIRERLQSRNRKSLIIKLSIVIVSLVVLIYFIGFYKF